MQPEANYDKDRLKRSQTVNEDYSNTGYDRGHLNPNSFQCEVGRKATFTLTNSAPMDPAYYVNWKRWEDAIRHIIKAEYQGTAFVVTGTVPSENDCIPRQGEFDDPTSRDFNRVSVPTHVWSSVCFVHKVKKERSFSFGYIGLNQANSKINVKTVPQLNKELSRLYHVDVRIFHDHCHFNNLRSEEIVKHLNMKVHLPLSDRLTMSEETLNIFQTAMTQFDDAQVTTKKPRVAKVTIEGSFDSTESWFANMQTMKYVSRSTCVLSQPYTGPVWSQTNTKIKKRDIPDGDGSQELVCSLIPKVEEGCTSSCLFKEEARGYRCYYYSSERPCSPQYSIITVSGAKCRSDHTCGTHGQQYYWCYTDSSWDYCSPPLPTGLAVGDGMPCRSSHNCDHYGWYGILHTWCYTDNNDNWDYCCRTADRFSARRGKTCRSNHPCGYHGYNYLWCYTTDGPWEYCCTK
ncbi:uncharacterized protein LOC134457719 [Engraulis encrasicolus]|uniref:uncharacterized protein LOC134457719 n=1 Tax=Engraulis encrasicolus TaxID=184585 RepID=UPI002FD5F7AB